MDRGSSLQNILSWGANSYGQLSQGHIDDVLTPRKITAILGHNITSITGGGGYTLAIADGHVYSCGSNEKGQLGQGHTNDLSTLTLVEDLKDWELVKVTAGWDFSLGITGDGRVYSWGSNAFGQLGRRTIVKSETLSPMVIELPPGEQAVDVAAGLRHVVLLTRSGRIFSWGQGRYGQLGVASPVSKVDIPCEVVFSFNSQPRKIACGSHHTVVLTDSGDVYVWGSNKHGQLALDPCSQLMSARPIHIPGSHFGGSRVCSIHSGWTHMLASIDNGTVFSWGRGDYGQLGRSCDWSHDWKPQTIAELEKINDLSCGSEHSLAVDCSGAVWSWGWNEHGMCATGDKINVKVPQKVALLDTYEVSDIGCGAGHCFVLASKTV